MISSDYLHVLTLLLQVRGAVTRSARLINLNGTPTKSDIPGVTWTYPNSVSLVPDVGGGQGKFIDYVCTVLY